VLQAVAQCFFLEHQRKDPPHFLNRVSSAGCSSQSYTSIGAFLRKPKHDEGVRSGDRIQHGRIRFKPSRMRAPGTVCCAEIFPPSSFHFLHLVFGQFLRRQRHRTDVIKPSEAVGRSKHARFVLLTFSTSNADERTLKFFFFRGVTRCLLSQQPEASTTARHPTVKPPIARECTNARRWFGSPSFGGINVLRPLPARSRFFFLFSCTLLFCAFYRGGDEEVCLIGHRPRRQLDTPTVKPPIARECTNARRWFGSPSFGDSLHVETVACAVSTTTFLSCDANAVFFVCCMHAFRL
jgi:hypothetical protein